MRRELVCIAPNCERPATDHLKSSAPMCQAHAVRLRSGYTIAFDAPIQPRLPPQSLAERLAALSVRDGQHLRWTGPVTKAGYPRLAMNGKWVLAHRASYTVHVGEIPPGHEVDHICRERWCIEPTHLRTLTRHDHMLHHDSERKRNALGQLLPK